MIAVVGYCGIVVIVVNSCMVGGGISGIVSVGDVRYGCTGSFFFHRH